MLTQRRFERNGVAIDNRRGRVRTRSSAPRESPSTRAAGATVMRVVPTMTVPPPCRSPNRLVEYARRLAGTADAPGAMPLFQDGDVLGAPSSSASSSGAVASSRTLTLGPVVVNARAMRRRSMERLPVAGGDGSGGGVAPEQMWSNPRLRAAPLAAADVASGVGDVRWWRSHVSFSVPYSPEVADYDPNWVNSAVQRVISDRGVTVHKLPSYAPHYWDASAASALGGAAVPGVARSWSLEERAARSVGSVRAPVGVALRCSHFLGGKAAAESVVGVTAGGSCVTGATVAALLSLARPRTLARGTERGATGLSLAKHSFAFEQSTNTTYPGVYPAIGVR
jgi:hypothetical protein